MISKFAEFQNYRKKPMCGYLILQESSPLLSFVKTSVLNAIVAFPLRGRAAIVYHVYSVLWEPNKIDKTPSKIIAQKYS